MLLGLQLNGGHECLIPEVEAAGLSSIQLTSRKSYGKRPNLFFTALCAPDMDYVEIQFEGTQMVATAFYPMKGQRCEKVQLKTGSALSFSPEISKQPATAELLTAKKPTRSSFYADSPAKKKAKVASDTGAAEKAPPNTESASNAESKPAKTGEAPGEAESRPAETGEMQVESPTKDCKHETPSKDGKQASRKKGKLRPVPDGMQRIPNSGGGDCLFLSIARGLNFHTPKPHLSVRAAVVTHLTKHSERYALWWDRLDPNEKDCESWDTYLGLAKKAGAYAGSLEVAAAAAHYGRQICVFKPELPNPEVYNSAGTKGHICLWHSSEHYEPLRKEVGVDLSREIHHQLPPITAESQLCRIAACHLR